MKLLTLFLALLLASTARAQANYPTLRVSSSGSWHSIYPYPVNSEEYQDPGDRQIPLIYDDGDLVAYAHLHVVNGNPPVTTSEPLTIRIHDVQSGDNHWKVTVGTYGDHYLLVFDSNSVNYDRLYNSTSSTAQPSNFRTLFPPAIADGDIFLSLRILGDLAYLFTGQAAGGESGVDATDWDYWFDLETGEFHDIYGGLTTWFGNGQTTGQFATFTTTTLALQSAQLQELSTVRSTLSSIYQLMNPTSPPLIEYEFDLEGTQLPDITEDLGFVSKRTETLTHFPDLLPPTLSRDTASPPEIEYTIDLDETFGGITGLFGANVPNMGSFTLNIDPEPFSHIRDPLHAIVYLMLSVWSMLFIWWELKRD